MIDEELILEEQSLSARRAWIEISMLCSAVKSVESLSARRAWIEMCPLLMFWPFRPWSLSARRAWIEITQRRDFKALGLVALRKESVDRNKYVVQCRKVCGGRSPQGERG